MGTSARRTSMTADGRVLFATRVVRLFAYGFLSVVLALYLAEAGLDEKRIGLLLTLTLVGDTAVSLAMTTQADRLGRRRTLLAGALLMTAAALVFGFTRSFWLLLAAATVGVISPSGNEVGPFLSIEQAALAHIVPAWDRTRVFAWYNLAGSFATALGAQAGGLVAQWAGYRANVLGYGLLGVLLAALFLLLSPVVEAGSAAAPSVGSPERAGGRATATGWGLHGSRPIVLRLAALFSLDAFGGGFVVQSIMAYWFHVRFGVAPAALGAIFLGANLLAGLSSLAAARVAARIGLVQTMVFTHLPSNILLLLVPAMPNLPAAVAVLLARFAISQMDVPTRQSYTMAVVAPEERSAAAGITGVARTTGAALAPVLTGPLLGSAALRGAPFVIAGTLKIVYDLLLWRGFRAHRPPEETPPVSS